MNKRIDLTHDHVFAFADLLSKIQYGPFSAQPLPYPSTTIFRLVQAPPPAPTIQPSLSSLVNREACIQTTILSRQRFSSFDLSYMFGHSVEQAERDILSHHKDLLRQCRNKHYGVWQLGLVVL